ncbi:MAG: hypothetical protein WBA22_18350 [Candidatus Methanofastidiosia archaeon]
MKIYNQMHIHEARYQSNRRLGRMKSKKICKNISTLICIVLIITILFTVRISRYGIELDNNIIENGTLDTSAGIMMRSTGEAISSRNFGFVGHIPLRGYWNATRTEYCQYAPGIKESSINAAVWTEIDNWGNAGTGIIRFDWFLWNEIEKGDDNWNFEEFDYLVEKVDQSNIEMAGLLAYGNDIEGCNPRDENNFDFFLFKPQYLEYVRQVVARYDGDNDYENDGNPDGENMPNIRYWEVWNEPLPREGFWEVGTTDQYAETLADAYHIIKSTNPEAKVLFAGVGTDSKWIHFTEGVLYYLDKNGCGQCFDILPIHTSYLDPSLGPEILSKLRALLDTYGYHPTIWANEVGCSGSYWKGEIPHGYSYWQDKRLSEKWNAVLLFPYEDQASLIAKTLITGFSEGIIKIFPYMSVDDAKSEASDSEEGGIFTYPGLMYDYYAPPLNTDGNIPPIGEQAIPFPFGKPKPALFSYTQVARKLENMMPYKILYQGSFYGYSFQSYSSDRYLTVLWTPSPEKEVTLHTLSSFLRVEKMALQSLPFDNSFEIDQSPGRSDDLFDYWWSESSEGNTVSRVNNTSLHGEYAVRIEYGGKGWAWIEPSQRVSMKINWKPKSRYKAVFYVQLSNNTEIDIGFNERDENGRWVACHDDVWFREVPVYTEDPPPSSSLEFHPVYDDAGNLWYRIEAEFFTPGLTQGDYLQIKIGAKGAGARDFLIDEIYFISTDGQFMLDREICACPHDWECTDENYYNVSIGSYPIYIESDRPINIPWKYVDHLSLRYLIDKNYAIVPREFGMYFVGGGQEGTVDLQACMKTDKSLYFDIDDDFADGIRDQSGLDVVISYYDNGDGGFKIEYGGVYAPACTETAIDPSEYRWHEYHIFINDAPLNNLLGNNDSDFEIIAQNGDIAVRSIEIVVAEKTETGIENLSIRDPALRTFTYDGKKWSSPAWYFEKGEGDVNSFEIRSGPFDDSQAVEMIFTGEKWLWLETRPRSSILTVLEPGRLYTLTFYARHIWGDNKISIGFNKRYKVGTWGGCVDHIWVGRIPKDFQWHRYTVLLKVPSFNAEEDYLQLKIGVHRELTESMEIFELSMVGIDPIVRFEDPSLEDQGKHWRFETGDTNSGVLSLAYVAFDGSYVAEMTYNGSNWLWVEPRSSQDILTHMEPNTTYHMVFHVKLKVGSENVITVGFNKLKNSTWLTCSDNVWAGIIPQASGTADGWYRFEVPVRIPNWNIDWSEGEWIQPKVGVVNSVGTNEEYFLLDMIGDDPIISVKDPSLEIWNNQNDLLYWTEECAGGAISRTQDPNNVYDGLYAALMNFEKPSQKSSWLWLDTGDASCILVNLRPSMRYTVIFYAKYISGDNIISVGFNHREKDGSWAGCVDSIWTGAIPEYQGFENGWFEFRVPVTTPDFDPNTQYLQLKIGTKSDITDLDEKFVLDFVALKRAKTPIIEGNPVFTGVFFTSKPYHETFQDLNQTNNKNFQDYKIDDISQNFQEFSFLHVIPPSNLDKNVLVVFSSNISFSNCIASIKTLLPFLPFLRLPLFSLQLLKIYQLILSRKSEH